MRALAVIFFQPALCNFPYFIQCSEQIKIQYFCPVRPVEPFDKGILRGLAGPNKFQHSHDPLRGDIQVNFDRQCFAVKIIHHVEGPEAPAAHQRIVHKIDGPALIHRLWRRQRSRITHRQALISLTAKIQFQQAVNTVNSFMVPDIALPAQHQKKLFKSVSRIAFSRHGQRHNHRLIASRIRLITKYRPAQRQCPACLT